MGQAEVTRPKPIPVPRVWRVWFRHDDKGITLFATSKREWSRGREGLGVETGVNKGEGGSWHRNGSEQGGQSPWHRNGGDSPPPVVAS